jgi:site-specific recombinase XerD
MRVQRVLMPGTDFESWTVLGEDHMPVESVERFLSYLASIEKSPNTIKAYAHDLKDWMTYLDRHGVDWRAARLEDVAGFVAWLRLPPQARSGRVAVLPTVAPHCSAASVNRKLSAVTSFCGFHARHGVELSGLLITMQPVSGRGRAAATSYRPFLHHVSKRDGERRRTIKLKSPQCLPKVLTAQQVQAILDACEHLRDRLLFALMLDTGVRVGEALGLRHEDVAIAEKTITITPRDNANRARAKSGSRTIPASPELMRLYADYLNREYGALDSDYVFVNLWSAPLGRPWSYSAVYDLVVRLRTRTGIGFGRHLFRHTYATWLLRRGAGMESVKELLGHASITTTIDTYGHLTVEDARQTLQAAGWFTGREVRL